MNKITKFIKENIEWIALPIFLMLFIIIAQNVLNKDVMSEDLYVYNILNKYIIREKVTPIMKVITNIGGAYIVLPLLGILVAKVKERKYKITIMLNLVLVTIINQVLKFIVQRPRPSQYRIVQASGYSFPSGHSMVSMAFYGYLIYLIYNNIKNKYLKWGLIALLAMLIVLIGLSRIYLGVHYASDVMAGFLLSLVYLILFVKLTNSDFIKKLKQ